MISRIWIPMAFVVLLGGGAAAVAHGEAAGGSGGTTPDALRLDPFPTTSEPKPLIPESARGTGPFLSPAKIQGCGLVVILGDLAPRGGAGGAVGDKYLKAAVEQLNLLRPDLVLTVGNLVDGLARDAAPWLADWEKSRTALDALTMPWYPCVGERDIFSGTRLPSDRRFETLYVRHIAPLYYSVDAGDVHLVVLDSEESTEGGPGLSEAQCRWLRTDLARTERAGRTRWILVTLHRPLWRTPEARNGWASVQRALGDFNRRPIVSVEGSGTSRAPRVVAVFAGHERAYAMDPGLDGIRYYVLGPTAAMPKNGLDAATALRGFMVLKLESRGAAGSTPSGGVFPALVTLGGESPKQSGPLLADDIISSRDRTSLDTLASLSIADLGIEGVLDGREPPAPGVLPKQPPRVVLHNPLKEPIDVSLRTASTRFLSTPSRREGANAYAEGFDLPWELSSLHMIRHLEPGATDRWPIDITLPAEAKASGPVGGSGIPPQLEFAVNWSGYEVILKRRVIVAPAARIIVATKPEELWNSPSTANGGGCYTWNLRGDEPRKLNPTFQLAADADRLYVKVRVDDGTPSYWPSMALDSRWGGLGSDAVSISWFQGNTEEIHRLWLLPFGHRGSELWTNQGLGDRQTPLVRLEADSGVTADAKVTGNGSGYEATFSIPRKLVMEDARESLINLVVHDNDCRARTWTRSWAEEEGGRATWGKVRLADRDLLPVPALNPKKEDGLNLFKVPETVFDLLRGLGGGNK